MYALLSTFQVQSHTVTRNQRLTPIYLIYYLVCFFRKVVQRLLADQFHFTVIQNMADYMTYVAHGKQTQHHDIFRQYLVVGFYSKS